VVTAGPVAPRRAGRKCVRQPGRGRGRKARGRGAPGRGL